MQGDSNLESANIEATEALHASEVTDQNKPDKKSKKKSVDPLTDYLGEKGYMQNARFPFLAFNYCGVRYALEVDRYYDNLKIAFDFEKRGMQLEQIGRAHV